MKKRNRKLIREHKSYMKKNASDAPLEESAPQSEDVSVRINKVKKVVVFVDDENEN
jgi:hypothetical protein